MTLADFSIQDWITIILLIAQAGIVYYRLKKVEQVAEKFTDVTIAFAVLKNSFETHQKEFEKFAVKTDQSIQHIDQRMHSIELRTHKILPKG